MNKKLGMIGSIINVITVLLFAIFMLFDLALGVGGYPKERII